MKKPRTLFFDIETMHLKASLSPILVFGYKWSDEKEVKAISIWDPELVCKGTFSKADHKLCKKLVELFGEADYLCGHYAQRFDRCFINSRLLMAGLPPIDKGLALIDTWRLSKDNLALMSNRLKQVAKDLGVEHQKLENGGWDTWQDAILGDKKAQQSLIRYCKGDVLCVEDVYTCLRPFDTKTNHSVFTDSAVCPSCGGNHSKSRGLTHTRAASYQRRLCLNCGRHYQVSKNGKKTK